MLHPVMNPPTRTKVWCGPSALSIITGEDYEVCRRAIHGITDRPVMYTTTGTMSAVLGRFGYTLAPQTIEGEPTLAAWLRARSPESARAVMLVLVSNHYIVVQGRKACDNHTRTPVFLSDMRLRRARVHRAYWVHAAPVGSRDRFVRVAERHGLRYAIDPTGMKLTLRAPAGKRVAGWTTKTFAAGDVWQVAINYLALIDLR